jgi:Secretion system C-terminal sorting domain
MDLHSGLVKTDDYGNMQWYQLYQVGEYTVPASVLQAKDEGYIVIAYAADSSYLNNNKHFLLLYKTNPMGATQWNKQYSLSGNDLPLNLVHRKAGGYISFSLGDYNLGTYPKTVVTVYEDDGDINWSKQFTAQYGLTGTKGIEMPNGNICFIAAAGDPAGSFFLDVVVTMIDQNGNLLWSKNFGTYYDDEGYALAANDSNEIFITGRNYFLNREWDSFLIKLDRFGNKLLSRVYDGGTSQGEIMRCILAYNDGSCKLLGDMGTFNERDITLLNVDSNASVVSVKRYAFSNLFTNYPYELFQAVDGGLVFTGDYRPPTALRDAILVKTESDGTLNCYGIPASISEYNEIFHDSVFSLTTSNSVVAPHAFLETTIVNPFLDHVVCPLSTSMEESLNEKENAISVFPNPAADQLTIVIDSPEHLKAVRIYSADGREIYSEKLTVRKNTYTLQTSVFPAGIYFLKCVFDTQVKGKRFVKY